MTEMDPEYNELLNARDVAKAKALAEILPLKKVYEARVGSAYDDFMSACQPSMEQYENEIGLAERKLRTAKYPDNLHEILRGL